VYALSYRAPAANSNACGTLKAEITMLGGVIPKPGVVQPGEGSRVKILRASYRSAPDPSLRLKSGSGQDDAHLFTGIRTPGISGKINKTEPSR